MDVNIEEDENMRKPNRDTFYLYGMLIGIIGVHLIWVCFFPLAWILGRIDVLLRIYPAIVVMSIGFGVISLIHYFFSI